MITQLRKWLVGQGGDNGENRKSDRCAYKKMVQLKSDKYAVVTATERSSVHCGYGDCEAVVQRQQRTTAHCCERYCVASTSRDEVKDNDDSDRVTTDMTNMPTANGGSTATATSVRPAVVGATSTTEVAYQVPVSVAATCCPTDDFRKYGRGKTGFSSLTTVLSVGGFLIVGLTLISSAVIVFCTQHHLAFRIVAAVFVACGVFFLSLCAMLQKKNITMLLAELKSQIGFFFSNRHIDKVNVATDMAAIPSPKPTSSEVAINH